MKSLFVSPGRVIGLIVLLGLAQAASADKYDDALESFQRQEATQPFFDGAHGYALFPTIGKGGIGIGGAYGEGRVYAQGEHVGDVSMSQLTIGIQLGGAAYSMIVFFEDERALREFTSGNFEFGAQASAVALTAAVSAEASTGGGTSATASGGRNDAASVQGGYRKGMAIFTVAKGGAMYEATLGGQKFKYKPLK
jgi:lipid-binding SYLF domain-containing protein